MTIQPNGTDAKDIVMKYLELNDIRATPAMFAKAMNQAKNILSCGYTREEIMQSLEYSVVVKGVKMFSLGYVSASIADDLREIEKLRKQMEAEQLVAEMKAELASRESKPQEAVSTNDESTQRNREKAERERATVQRRLGKKFDFDMFEGQ